jgi:hypothetical protein
MGLISKNFYIGINYLIKLFKIKLSLFYSLREKKKIHKRL